MRIAISGTHGTGKTTLMKKLEPVLKLPTISEVARIEAAKMGFKTTEEIKKSPLQRIQRFQENVFWGQVTAEKRCVRGFLSDRSIFDAVAYMKFYGIKESMCNEYEDKAKKHSAGYDVIFYTPIPDNLTEDKMDKFRLKGRNYQEAYDKIIYEVLKWSKCPVIELSRNRDEWADTIIEMVGE